MKKIIYLNSQTNKEVHYAKWEGFVEGAEWMLKECKNYKNR